MDLLNRPRVLLAGLAVALATVGVALTRLLADLVVVVLILVILALVVALVFMWLRQKRERKQGSADIESTIVKQADREIERSVAAQAADIADMKSELLKAIQALKAARGGAEALATLPWYLVMGPSRSGKGTLIRHSGLRFPLKDESGGGPRSIKGFGGTRAMEWWVTEEALLLEMPGRLLSSVGLEDEDWIEFLLALKKARGKKGINGVIVAAGIDQVADRPDAELERLGRRIRERISELSDRLEIQFPTYLVLTGCDRFAGFSDFFADWEGDKRSQPWGVTVPVERAARHRAEDLFDEEFRQLGAALARRTLGRTSQLLDDEPRARVFAFPQQLERVRPFLRRVVGSVFDSTAQGQKPLFRGFYLTSAAPAGNAVDRVYVPAAAALGLAAAEPHLPSPGGGPWFVQELFTRVIVPDKDLVTDTDEARRKKARVRRYLTIALGGLLGLFAITCSWISCDNLGPVRRARESAADLRTIGATADFRRYVEALESLRSSIERLERLEGRVEWWRHLGGYWGSQAIKPALDTHAKHTLSGLVRPALPRMAADLDAMVTTGSLKFAEVYYRYWAWRVLQRPGELTDGDAQVAAEGVRQALAGVEIAGVEAGQRERIAALVELNVRFLAEHDGLAERHKGVYVTGEDGVLLQRSTEWVRRTWSSEQLYRHMVLQSEPATAALDLGSLLGGKTGRLECSRTVPGPFTREGWRRAAGERIRWYRSRMQRPWAVEAFPDSAPRLAEALERRYAAEYSRQWQDFLSAVTIKRATTLQEYVVALTDVAAAESPLFVLLRQAGKQTDFSNEESPAISGIAEGFDLLQSFERAPFDERAKDNFFRRILGRLFPRRRKAGEYDPSLSDKRTYITLLGTLKNGVADCQQKGGENACVAFFSPTPGTAGGFDPFMQFGRDLITRHNRAGINASLDLLWLPLEMLPAITPPDHPRRGEKPDDVGGRIKGPVDDGTPRPCMPDVINARWQAAVVTPFDNLRLANKYPLVAAGPDAPLADLAEFFKPNGPFWSFYNAELRNYLQEDGTPLPTAGNMVPPDLRAAVRAARDIRDALFAAGSDQPAFQFRVRAGLPVADQGVTPNFYWTELSIGAGQPPIQWNLGPRPWLTGSWPGPSAGQGASVRANGAGTVLIESGAGVWGFFRLLDNPQTRITHANNTAQVSIRLSSGQTAWRIPYEFQAMDGSARHPFRKGSLRFRLPSTLCPAPTP